jgi:hypothetical protein
VKAALITKHPRNLHPDLRQSDLDSIEAWLIKHGVLNRMGKTQTPVTHAMAVPFYTRLETQLKYWDSHALQMQQQTR